MKEYFLEEFQNPEDYQRFIEYMLLHSEFFSVIYFRYRENDPLKKRTKSISDSLRKYKV